MKLCALAALLLVPALACEWNNRSDQTVRFGTSVDSEMCFFWAYYFPSRGPLVCLGSC